MCAIASSVKTDCCRKLEIVFPSMSKEALEKIVTFLYSGKIICDKKSDASQTLSNLTKLLGYPDVMDFSQSIKDDEDLEYENVNFYRNSDNSKPEFHPLELELDQNQVNPTELLADIETTIDELRKKISQVYTHTFKLQLSISSNQNTLQNQQRKNNA